MPSIHPLTRRLQLAGVAIVVVLTALVWVILEIGPGWPKAAVVGGFAAAALIAVSLVERWFMRMIIRPLAATERVAVRPLHECCLRPNPRACPRRRKRSVRLLQRTNDQSATRLEAVIRTRVGWVHRRWSVRIKH